MGLTVNNIDAKIVVSAESAARALEHEKFIQIQERNLAMKIALALWHAGMVQRETAPDGTVTLSVSGSLAYDEGKMVLTTGRSEATTTTVSGGEVVNDD